MSVTIRTMIQLDFPNLPMASQMRRSLPTALLTVRTKRQCRIKIGPSYHHCKGSAALPGLSEKLEKPLNVPSRVMTTVTMAGRYG